jgi:hypothetical protein
MSQQKQELVSKILLVFLMTSLAACAGSAQPSRLILGFDARYVYDLFTRLDADRGFPFQLGEHIQMEIFLMRHPLQPWVYEQLSPDVVWFGTGRPYGEPDPTEPSFETIMIDIASQAAPENKWHLPWQIDQDDALVVVVETGIPLGRLGSLANGDGVPAKATLEISMVEALETIPETGERIWRVVLIPAGEAEQGLIYSEVEISLP